MGSFRSEWRRERAAYYKRKRKQRKQQAKQLPIRKIVSHEKPEEET